MKMNKTFSKEDKKDRFITDHLLPYLLKYIDDSDDPDSVLDSVARMYVFPYITSDGVRIGSLKEPGVSWYYIEENDKSIISSGSYRVFADDLLKQEQAKRLRQLLVPEGLIAEFSDEAVVKDLILRMSKENDYSELWWTCAYDVFILWKPEKGKIDMSNATKSVNSNCFLFDEDYVGNAHKDELIRFGIFRDILTGSARRLFWDRIPSNEKKKAKEVLRKFGVPCTFVDTVERWNGVHMQSNTRINPYILRFAKGIGEKVAFPVAPSEKENEKCSLCHWLFMDVIYKESKAAFEDAVYDENEEYSEGIVVKNIYGDYVPLSWYLFYSKDDLDEKDWDDEEDLRDENENTGLELEYLHIDATLYDLDFIINSEKILDFSEVCESADEYDIEKDDIEEFYKWVWNYSKHAELAENILSYYSGNTENRMTIDEDANDFVLSVIENYDGENSDYKFDIDIQDTEAFLHSDTINKINTIYKEIYAVVYGKYGRTDVSEYVKRILDATEASYSVKSEIESNEIWDHVYLTDGEINEYDGIFVKCKIYDEDYEDAIVLWPSEDEDSYVRALAEYIRSHYDVEVAIEAAEAFDWKEEYLSLAQGIREFISEKTARRLPEDLYGFIADMEDVKDFGTEKKIWLSLKSQRERLITHETGKCPIDLSSWRTFLSSKYTGRCQLCGGKTITGEQNAHFYTYRLVKPSGNSLADMTSNMFCLCPSCWGEMGQGDFMGKDLSELIERTSEYSRYIEQKIKAGEMEDNFPSLVSEVWEDQLLTEEDEEKLEGFHNPIVCHVMVNGKDRSMAFSWEHFMRIAFILLETEGKE